MNIYNVRQMLKTRSIFEIELRVVYYARVSTEKEEQRLSIGHQQEYYDDFIKGVPKWEFAGKYVDEGISGLSAMKREAFQKMIEDAREDKFDLIITKEISRFARNTLDSIRYTRELLMNGTAVWFQTDNINTLDEDSELRLSIMAAMAQDEIRKLSMRVRFGHARSIKNGVVLGNSMIYGWDKKNGSLVVNEEEAKMVRIIFQKYSTGLWTTPQLETYLYNEGYRNRKGAKISRGVIGHIITNPKYKGYYVGGKVKVVDIFTKKQEFLPEDEWTMFKDDGSRVPAIVDEDTWEMANQYYRERSRVLKSHGTSCKPGNPFTGMIRCANDGAAYWLKCKDRGSLHDTTWVCSHRIKNGAASCSSFPVNGSELKKILFSVFNRLSSSKEEIIESYMQLYEEVSRNADNSAESAEKALEKEISQLKQKRDKILDYNLSGVITDSEFIKRNKEFTEQIDNKEKELGKLRRSSGNMDDAKENLFRVFQAASRLAAMSPDNIDQFVVREAVDHIIIAPTGDHKATVSVFLKTPARKARDEEGRFLVDRKKFSFERLAPSSARSTVTCEYLAETYY